MSQYIDKSWINKPRNTEAYIKGVSEFMKFAKKETQNGFIRCPCCKCQIDRKKVLPLEEVERHILFKGFYKKYKDWIFHGPMTIAENVCNQIGIPFVASKWWGAPEFGSELNEEGLANETIEEPNLQYESNEFPTQRHDVKLFFWRSQI